MKRKGQVKFTPRERTDFFPVLKKRVDTYFEEKGISKQGNAKLYTKSVVLLLMYLVPFIAMLIYAPAFWPSMLLWFIMGIGVAGIGMSVMHDANHGAYSANDRVNYWMGNTLNLLGGSTFNWKLQHNIMHHTYTNISGMDDDIQDRLVLTFSPHTEKKKFHRYQWIYAFAFYGLMTFYWVALKDFIQFHYYTKKGVNPNRPKDNRNAIIRIAIMKVAYFFALIVVPIVFFSLPILTVITGFLLMHFVAGFILTLVFQLAHTVEGTEHPLPNEHGVIENDWAIHQMETTQNFSPKSKVISWYVGGLNYQVEHHLFPRVSHVHYPNIAHIVKQTAEEYGVPYKVSPTFAQAIGTHIAALKKFGRLPGLNDAIG